MTDKAKPLDRYKLGRCLGNLYAAAQGVSRSVSIAASELVELENDSFVNTGFNHAMAEHDLDVRAGNESQILAANTHQQKLDV